MATKSKSYTIDENTLQEVEKLAEKEERSVSKMISILLREALIARNPKTN